MRRSGRVPCSWILLSLFLATLPAAAQDTNATTLDRSKWGDFYLEMAKQIRVEADAFGDATLTPKPFFHWENPVRVGRTAGDFFIWFAHDQPVLVGTLFSYDWPTTDLSQRAVAVELHGLSEHGMQVSYGPNLRWTAPANAVQASRLTDTPAPRNRRSQRLVEMRRIASRIQASTNLEGRHTPLRLLPTPLYRFERPETIADDEQVLDGGIFAMVTGTDPELLLVIQALRVDDQQFAWFLTTAGFTDLPTTVKLDDEIIFQQAAPAEDRLYFRHGVHRVPTVLGPAADAMIGR